MEIGHYKNAGAESGSLCVRREPSERDQRIVVRGLTQAIVDVPDVNDVVVHP